MTFTRPDDYVEISAIAVVERHRKDLGDLDALAASIKDVDLLNPITLTRDNRLVAGQRRLEACRQLGWTLVPVRFIDSLDDAAKLLRAERDENTERKDMLPSEKASLGAALEGLEHEAARQRQREHGGTAPGRGRNTPSSEEGSVPKRRIRDDEAKAIVGQALGMGRSNYYYLASVRDLINDEAAPDDERAMARSAMEAIDGGAPLQITVRKLRQSLRAKREAKAVVAAAMTDPEPEPAPLFTDPDWIPAHNDSTQRGVERRREIIRTLASEGWSSYQIADHIGIQDGTVRKIARDADIVLQADRAMGRGTRKHIDSNRIVRETVNRFAGLEFTLGLINFDELDRAEIKEWTTSLTDAIRELGRLNRRLKEMAQ